LVADTVRGRALRGLLPADAIPWVPEIFYVECGAVLRRWDLNRILTAAQTRTAVDELMVWPLRIAQVRPLLRAAWSRRANMTIPDGVYVTLAEHLRGLLLTDDHRLARAPGMPVPVLRLPSST
jgi:predicted nucleic acid-binding protein